MSVSTVTDMNLAGSKQQSVVNGGGGAGRRKSKGTELTQKKHKQPQRGMGVAQLEHLRKITEASVIPHHLPPFNPGFTAAQLPNAAAVQYYRPAHVPTPAMLVQGIGIHGANVYMDPSVIGSNNGGFRFENPKELYSIPSYMKCGSDGCGVCHKKMRISCNHCTVKPLPSSFVEMTDAGRDRRSSRQVTDIMSVRRNGGSSMTEYEFFPGKGGGVEEYKELMSLGSTAAWYGSGGSGAGAVGLGFRGGEGSCVTAITGGEEGSVSSIDLSLKLSY